MATTTRKTASLEQLSIPLGTPLDAPETGTPGNAAVDAVLLAVTDDDLAPAAIAVTRALQTTRHARPSVLYVIQIAPSPPEGAVVALALEEELRDPRVRATQEREMRAVLHLDDGAPAAWPFEIRIGSVAGTIVTEARRQGAELIVMGLNPHARLARAIGNDTVHEVMALGGIPVLAVRPELTGLPRRVVVAIDFSRASIRAAHLARRLVDEHGSMHLIFIESTMLSGASESTEGLRLIQTRGLEAAFGQLVTELAPSDGLTIETIVREGSPADEIPRFCEDIHPDLVVVGSQRHRFLDRLLLGSVARTIAEDGRWSTLVTPPIRRDDD